jgi:hypothetical membrane protein
VQPNRLNVPKNVMAKGLLCLIAAGVIFFAGQFLAQFSATQPYSMKNQAISDLGITSCGPYTEYATHKAVSVCVPLHLVMSGTFVAYGALIMLGVSLALRFLWPQGRFRKSGLVLMFFGGIEAVVSGFSPINLEPVLHSISGGLAIFALNISLILLGVAAKKEWKWLGRLTIFAGVIGVFGSLMDGQPPYAGLGYGGWERVAGYVFALWVIAVGLYLRSKLNKNQPLPQ